MNNAREKDLLSLLIYNHVLSNGCLIDWNDFKSIIWPKLEDLFMENDSGLNRALMTSYCFGFVEGLARSDNREESSR